MDKEWVKIFSTTELYKARLFEVLLKENGIACHVLNKQDSAYVVIGEIEIYVQEKDKAVVLEWLSKIE